MRATTIRKKKEILYHFQKIKHNAYTALYLQKTSTNEHNTIEDTHDFFQLTGSFNIIENILIFNNIEEIYKYLNNAIFNEKSLDKVTDKYTIFVLKTFLEILERKLQYTIFADSNKKNLFKIFTDYLQK